MKHTFSVFALSAALILTGAGCTLPGATPAASDTTPVVVETENPADTLTQYYDVLSTGTNEELVDFIHPLQLEVTPQDEWFGLWDNVRERLGAVDSFEVIETSEETTDGTTHFITLTTRVFYAQAYQEEQVTLLREEDETSFRIRGIDTQPLEDPRDTVEEEDENEVTSETVGETATTITGTLSDVSGGIGSGTVTATFANGTYTLDVEMRDIPAPTGTDFYEGWVVRTEPFNFESTGVVTQAADGTWINEFSSETDLTDHARYILTLEPDDGDPAPAEHILEGDME